MTIKREIDPRLLSRGTKIVKIEASPGQSVWKLVEAKFFPAGNGEGFSGGRYHVYIEAMDGDGNPVSGIEFQYSWPGHTVPIVTNGKTGFDAANQPFSTGRNAFSVSKSDGDSVVGIGMGQDDPDGWNAGQHTSTLLRYQLVIEDGSVEEPDIPEEDLPTEPEERTLLATIKLYDDGTYELDSKAVGWVY